MELEEYNKDNPINETHFYRLNFPGNKAILAQDSCDMQFIQRYVKIIRSGNWIGDYSSNMEFVVLLNDQASTKFQVPRSCGK